MRRRLTSALAAAALALLAACGGSELTGPGGTRPTIGGSTGTGGSGGGATNGGTLAAQLVGRWSRTIWYYDSYGAYHSSETVWTFASDGGAARTVYSRNHTDGWSDAVVTLARWHVEGRDVVIAYQPPDGGTARFPVRFESSIDGPILYLGDTFFYKVRQ